MRTALGVATLVGCVSWLSLVRTFFPHPDEAAILGLLLLVLGQVFMVWTLWRGRLSGTSALVVTAVTTVGLWLSVDGMQYVPSLSDTWWPRTILIATPSYLVVSHRRGGLMAGALIAFNAALHLKYWRPNASLPAMTAFQEVAAESGQYIAYAAIAVVAVRVMRAAAHQADEAVLGGRQARESAAAGRVELDQIREADRFVHDEVLQTLRLIAMDRSVVPAATASRAAQDLRRLLEMQQEAPAEQGFVERLRSDCADLGLTVRIVGAGGLSLPAETAAVLAQVIRECLRNVARHADTQEAEVRVRRSGFALSVVVKDSGRGFDTTTMSARLGLRESVFARMADIGGTARIVSAPGRGTSVHLRWSPIPQTQYQPRSLGGGAVAQLFPSMAVLIIPALAQGLWAAAFLAGLTRAPLLAAAATVAAVGAGIWAIRRGLRVGLTGVHSMSLGVLAWACAALSVLVLPTESAHPRLLWLAVTVTGIASVISIFRPLWEAIVVGVGIMVLTVVMLRLTQGQAPLAPNLPIVLAPVITVGIAVSVRRLIDRCAFEIWSNEERMKDVRSGLTDAEFFKSRLDQRLLGSSSGLITLLDEVVADPDLISHSRTRERAGQLERALRDLISVNIDPELAAALTSLYAGGWTVRTLWGSEPPGQVQREVARALAALPARPPGVREGTSVTVTASQQDQAWRMSVLIRPATGAWVQDYDPGPGWETVKDAALHARRTLPAGCDVTSEIVPATSDRVTG